MRERKFGVGTLSFLLTVMGVLWSCNYGKGVCIGDNILDFLGLPPWSNGSTGMHLTIFYSLIFFGPAIWLGNKYNNDFGAKIGKAVSIIFVVGLTLIFFMFASIGQ